VLVANLTLAVLDVPVVRSEQLVGVLCLDAPEVHAWTDDERETLREVSRYLSLALTTETVRHDLEERTREWEMLFELIPDMLCVASTDGWFLKLNRSWERVLGHRREELLASPYADYLHPDDVTTTRQEVERQSAGQDTVNFVNRYRTVDGTYRWLEWWATPVIGDRLYAAARDITERREQEQRIRSLLSERELIVREAHHRIKNDLNIVQSMLSLQARQNRSKSARESLSVAGRRVGAIARVYEKLQRTSDMEVVDAAAFVPSVVSDVQSSSNVRGLRVSVDVEPVRLPSRLAVAVGIVTNELVTNAVKYAFVGVGEPTLRITGWSDADGRFHLRVADNGVGLSADLLNGKGGGFGMAVVDALVSQHAGAIHRENDGGTVVRVSVPLKAGDRTVAGR